MRTNERLVLTNKQGGPRLTPLTGRPADLQSADDIRTQIVGGALRGNDRLPSEPELITDYGVSRIVVQQALDVLKAEGLIVKQRGRGSFVSSWFKVSVSPEPVFAVNLPSRALAY
jgi:DNA-binding GntR family transcriptional regulator